jgi:hypothetical protein
MSALDALRGELPASDIEALEAIAAELAEAASSPQALRRWEKAAAREREQEAVVLRAAEIMTGRAMKAGDLWP